LNTAEVVGITSVTGDRLRQPARGAPAPEFQIVFSCLEGELDAIQLDQLKRREFISLLSGGVKLFSTSSKLILHRAHHGALSSRELTLIPNRT